MKSLKLELGVGIFVMMGLVALGWLSIKLARMELLGGDYMPLYARFTSVAGLKSGASVEIAGVEVGRVGSITIDPQEYEAVVQIKMRGDIQIQQDAIASVRTKGLIGDRFVKITPGGSDKVLGENGVITQTEPAINFEELISQFVHGKVE